MSGVRDLIRRWLGVPTAEQVREIVLREIDADAVWREEPSATTHKVRRMEKETSRHAAIMLGGREDTRRG